MPERDPTTGRWPAGDGRDRSASAPARGDMVSGPGLYGGASGALAVAFNAENQPAADAKVAGRQARVEFRRKLAEKLDAVEAVYDAALVDPDNRVRLVAAKQISVELWGQPTQEISGPEGGAIPTSLTVSFVRPGAAERED